MLPNTKVSIAKDDGDNYMKLRPPMVCHLFRNGLRKCLVHNWVAVFG